MVAAAAAAPTRRRKNKVVLQDVDLLKAQRIKLKQDLKAMSRNLKLQIQKKRRIMRAANVMDDEDLQWLLKERERAKSNRDAQERSERTEAGEEVNAEASSARER